MLRSLISMFPPGEALDGKSTPPHATTFDAHGHSQVLVPGGDFLIHADYARLGHDLILRDAGHEVVVRGFFDTELPPALISDNGARISGVLAARLAGPVAPGQYAQAGSAAAAAAAEIGHVQVIGGGATARHIDGTITTLAQASPVFQGDVVQTGSGAKLGIVFEDKTTLALGENARLVLDRMIYNPTSHEGSVGLSLLHGAFVEVTGEIGNHRHASVQIDTPVGNIGIRGTDFAVRIANIGAQSVFTLLAGAIDVTTHVNSVFLDQPYLSTISTGFDAPLAAPFLMSPQEFTTVFGIAEAVSQALIPFGLNPTEHPELTPPPPAPTPPPPPAPILVPSMAPLPLQPIEFYVLPFLTPAPPSGLEIGTNYGAEQQLLGPSGPGIGTAGDDILYFGNGVTAISGLGGNDTIIWQPGDGNVTADGGPGTDTLIVYGDPTAPNTISVAGDNLIVHGTSPVDFTINAVNVENVAVFGGNSGNTLDASASLLPENELYGGSGNDTLTGGTGVNVLSGGDGNDILIGGPTTDYLYGGAGNDTLTGGSGNDYLNGGPGADSMSGGTGNDTYVVDSQADVVSEQPGQGTDTVHSSVSYTLPANVEDLYLTGSGNLIGSGNSEDNLIVSSGVAGDTALYGLGGNDTLIGGTGNDTLVGGAGSDVLTGGTGADTFSYTDPTDGSAVASNIVRGTIVGDTLTDFASGQDTLLFESTTFNVYADNLTSLSLIDSTTNSGNGHFTTISTAYNGTLPAGLSNAYDSGTPTFIYSTVDNTLYYDPNGSSAGYTVIATLSSGGTLHASDVHVTSGG